MDYFISHIGYIWIAGLLIAALALGAAYFASKSQEENVKHGYDPDWDKSEFACQGCKLVGICNGMASLKPKDPEELEALKDEFLAGELAPACGKMPQADVQE